MNKSQPCYLTNLVLRKIAPAIALTLSTTAFADTEQQQALYDIAKNVSAENIEKDITTLVNFGTRHTLSERSLILVVSVLRDVGLNLNLIKFQPSVVAA